MTDEDLQESFEQELRASAEGPPISLLLSPIQAWLLFSHLQLALRHPANASPSSQIVRVVAKRLEARLDLGPAMATMAARGHRRQNMMKPQYDEITLTSEGQGHDKNQRH